MRHKMPLPMTPKAVPSRTRSSPPTHSLAPVTSCKYDSYRECYDLGHTFYQHVVSTEGHDLPLHVGIGPASETDVTRSLKSLDRLRKALREQDLPWQIRHGVYLAFHDGMGIYEYLDSGGITPIIAINPRATEAPAPCGTAERVNADRNT